MAFLSRPRFSKPAQAKGQSLRQQEETSEDSAAEAAQSADNDAEH